MRKGATTGRVEAGVMSPAPSSIDLAHEPFHLLQRAAQHKDVVARKQQGGYFGELAHGWPMSIGHDLSEPVHGDVEVVHAFSFAAVDLEAHVLQFRLG